MDLGGREEVSITGPHPALYLHHPDPPPGGLLSSAAIYCTGCTVHPVMAGQERHYQSRQSYSDTSSLYSGSDTVQSLQSGQEEMDLSGLHESVVDRYRLLTASSLLNAFVQ